MGRSAWILDDITPIREWSPRIAGADAYLFQPAPAVRWRRDREREALGAGENPPRGAIINYYLKHKPKGEIRLEIRDAQGALVRTLRSTADSADYRPDDPDEPTEVPKPALAADSGVQRAVWDLRYEGARKLHHAKVDQGEPSVGPLVLPGTYALNLMVDGRTLTSRVEVRADPRVKASPQDLADQLRLELEMRDQVGARADLWKAQPTAGPLVAASTALTDKLDSLEARLHNPRAEVTYDILMQRGGARLYSRLAPVYTWATEADGAPTQGMREVFAAQTKELDALEAEFRSLTANDLAALNRQARELGLADIAVPATPAPAAR
jgi:hypothetical protein